MSWVLVAVGVVWVVSLLLVVALCLSARRSDKRIFGLEALAEAPPSASAEPPSELEDITVRRPALS